MYYAFRLVNRCFASLTHEASHILNQLRWHSGKPNADSANDTQQKRGLLAPALCNHHSTAFTHRHPEGASVMTLHGNQTYAQRSPFAYSRIHLTATPSLPLRMALFENNAVHHQRSKRTPQQVLLHRATHLQSALFYPICASRNSPYLRAENFKETRTAAKERYSNLLSGPLGRYSGCRTEGTAETHTDPGHCPRWPFSLLLKIPDTAMCRPSRSRNGDNPYIHRPSSVSEFSGLRLLGYSALSSNPE